MDFTLIENQFKVLGSATRLQVIDLLLQNKEGLRFSEIAKKLDIYPSTLEDHLKRLIDAEFISHMDGRYQSNVNTERVHLFARTMHDSCTPSYFSTHLLAIEEPSLKDRFLTLECDGVIDLLALMNKAKSIIDDGLSIAKVGGAMDMQLEVSFFEFYPMDLREADLEILFTKHLLEEFLQHEKRDLFMQGFNPKRSKIYIVDDCKFAMMTTTTHGALFLPHLNGKTDFTQGLFFSNPQAVDWLNDLFDYTKSKGDELSPREISKIWK